jgi:hypothetical protein
MHTHRRRLDCSPTLVHSSRKPLRLPTAPIRALTAGVFVQSGRVASAGDLLPGPTGRVAAGGAGGTGGALQSGLGELPIVSTGTIAAASTYGSGGAAVAVAAPSAYYVGGGSRATAIGDVTGL